MGSGLVGPEAPSAGKPLVVVLGPTAVGKSRFAVLLARRVDGEIVSADSAMVYRGLDVGTDKPGPADRAAVPHHLLDVVNPDEPFNVSDFVRLAAAAVDRILARGRLPLLVGGTGLWIRAFVAGYRLPPVPPDPRLRRRLAEEAERSGPEALHARLAALDPAGAAALDPRNVRRVIRALEISLATGSPASALAGLRSPPPYDALKVGLTRDREELYRLIEARVERQLAGGLVEEVRGLLARGYPAGLQAFQALGYKEVIAHLRGECSREEMVRALKRNTRRFAKRQLTWFRREPDVVWFNLSTHPEEEVLETVASLIAGRRWTPGRGRRRPSP